MLIFSLNLMKIYKPIIAYFLQGLILRPHLSLHPEFSRTNSNASLKVPLTGGIGRPGVPTGNAAFPTRLARTPARLKAPTLGAGAGS